MRLPPFKPGIDYEELRGGKYRFRLRRDVALHVPPLETCRQSVSFRDANGREWSRLVKSLWIIRPGYAWNGASPKWWIPLLGWVGTPDPEPTRLATLYHDMMFQFLRTEHFPLTIGEANDLFREIMISAGFRWPHTYHGAVTDFGELFTGKYPKKGEYSVLI